MSLQANLSASLPGGHATPQGKDFYPSPAEPALAELSPGESSVNLDNVIMMDIPAGLAHVHILSRCACALLDHVSNVEEREINLYNLELAIQEISVNIVKHAYDQVDGRIRMCVTLEEQPLRLIVTLYDTGKAFDPTKVPQPELGELQEHGFGLFLVQQLMDEVEYNHSPTGNRWKLIKNIPLAMSGGH